MNTSTKLAARDFRSNWFKTILQRALVAFLLSVALYYFCNAVIALFGVWTRQLGNVELNLLSAAIYCVPNIVTTNPKVRLGLFVTLWLFLWIWAVGWDVRSGFTILESLSDSRWVLAFSIAVHSGNYLFFPRAQEWMQQAFEHRAKP